MRATWRACAALALSAGLAFGAAPANANVIKHVFVIVMENEDSSSIYGDAKAPYINSLLETSAHTLKFADELPGPIPSEPHYVYMEAGTNAFSDHTFTTDEDPSAANSTSSPKHLVTQMKAKGVTWRSYVENRTVATGACPIVSAGLYAAKHVPFVFFHDVAGSPPSSTAAPCVNHTSPFTDLARDIAAKSVPGYAFITPNLCDDMHGATGCVGNEITLGDTWLKQNLPALIAYAKANAGVIFITWDEAESTPYMAFIAVGPGVKPGYASSVAYDHGSMLKSVEGIFGLPYLATVTHKNDLADLFKAGAYP